LYGREIVAVLKIRESAFPAEAPGEVVVVGYEAHVVGVDCAEGGQAIADDGEEGDEHVVDYVYYVVVAATDVDPSFSCSMSFFHPNEEMGRGLPIKKRTQINPKSVISVA
jgi:hypothetical protein